MTRHDTSAQAVLDARGIWRDFSGRFVLSNVSMQVAGGDIHALLGPNGAGKTTMLRILTGLIEPTLGRVVVAGKAPRPAQRGHSAAVGFVSSSDRSFYLRISGLENLIFFGRMHGLTRREAKTRAAELLEQVGLEDAARRRAYEYSHGMLKRLSFARALLARPPVFLVDEATHDLDPEGAMRIRELTRGVARTGTAVVWTTQRIEEIQGLADHVTVLVGGQVAFRGGVLDLVAQASTQAYVMTVQNGGASGDQLLATVRSALRTHASVKGLPGDDGERFVVVLHPGVLLGDAFSALASRDLTLVACREERPGIEEAFLKIAAGERK